MTITYHPITDDFYQGSDPWRAARTGLLTASEMKLIITPKRLELAANDKMSAHLYELAAQRITNYVEPTFIGDEMVRGQEDEVYARMYYSEHYAPVIEMGFITNDKWDFTIGYSPDGLVGDDGLIETKSRRQKFQLETIVEGGCPTDYWIQVQTGLLVSERQWLDFISYSGGMPMFTIRCRPDPKIQDAIVSCAGEFDRRVEEAVLRYRQALVEPHGRFIPTPRREQAEWL